MDGYPPKYGNRSIEWFWPIPTLKSITVFHCDSSVPFSNRQLPAIAFAEATCLTSSSLGVATRYLNSVQRWSTRGWSKDNRIPVSELKRCDSFKQIEKIGEDKNNQTQENSYNHLHGNNKTIRYINIDKPWKTINWREQKHDKHHPHAASHRLPRNYPPPSTHVSLKHLDFHNLE